MRLLLTLLLSLAVAACGGDDDHGHDHDHDGHGHDAGGDVHGEAAALGSLTLAGRTFTVTRLGDVTPGQEAAFEVSGDATGASVFLWVETKDGQQVSAPAKGDLEKGALHFHAAVRADAGEPFRVVLRVRADGKDERGGLPLSGHGHEHAEGAHHGVVAALGDGDAHLELKLHDDKGDLELWLYRDAAMKEPLDLPLDTVITVAFVDHGGRKVTLTVRDRERNEDEDGNPNVRAGKTNYFIFPGDSGQDASWLKGKAFQSVVQVTFGEMKSEEFVLVPHAH